MRANWDHTASTYNDFATGQNFMGPSRDRILAAVATFAKEHKGRRLASLPHPPILVGTLLAAHATSCRGFPDSHLTCKREDSTQLLGLHCLLSQGPKPVFLPSAAGRLNEFDPARRLKMTLMSPLVHAAAQTCQGSCPSACRPLAVLDLKNASCHMGACC